MSTRTRFEKEAKGNSEMAYLINGKMSLTFCIIIESNFQKTFSVIVLYTNMAAVTLRKVSRGMLNCKPVTSFPVPFFFPSSIPLEGKERRETLGARLCFYVLSLNSISDIIMQGGIKCRVDH